MKSVVGIHRDHGYSSQPLRISKSYLLDFGLDHELPLDAVSELRPDDEDVGTLLVEGDIGAEVFFHAHQLYRRTFFPVRPLDLDRHTPGGDRLAFLVPEHHHEVMGLFHPHLGHGVLHVLEMGHPLDAVDDLFANHDHAGADLLIAMPHRLHSLHLFLVALTGRGGEDVEGGEQQQATSKDYDTVFHDVPPFSGEVKGTFRVCREQAGTTGLDDAYAPHAIRHAWRTTFIISCFP